MDSHPDQDKTAEAQPTADRNSSPEDANVVRQLLNAKVAEKDEAPLALIGLRDLTALSVLLAIVGGAESWARLTDLAIAQFVLVFLGLIGGVALAALGHEWGHLAGARLSGGHSPIRPLKAFPQVCRFDFASNSHTSFICMSVGGSVGNWAMTLVLIIVLQLGSMSAQALIAGAVAFSVFISRADFPIIKNARTGMSAREAYKLVPKNLGRRYGAQALVAAFLTFILL